MSGNRRRPFYAEYAWAFDMLIDRPVRKECAAIVAWLIERGVFPGAKVLDAGCGTGRYSRELARRGYVVHGIDLSPELIAVAERSSGEQRGRVAFTVGDILPMSAGGFDAVLCRGVLNDMVDDASRDAAFDALARALRPGGVLVLDVRDWDASAERKAQEPVFRKRVSTYRGELTFTSVTEVDPEGRRLLVSERHVLAAGGQERISDHRFVMRCWTRGELRSALLRCRFSRIRYFGAYDARIVPGASDRLVAVAERLAAPA